MKKLTLVLATNNAHKVAEIRAILKRARIPATVLTLADFPPRRPVVEDKSTIEGNAAKKAREVARNTGHLALADDTGLFVNALRGKPGVYSARFAGPGCDFMDNNRKVLRLMSKTPARKRKAVFRCIAALASPRGDVLWAEGKIVGQISPEMKGRRGFGYDPIFLVPSLGKTFAQLPASKKNVISHRARAFSQVPRLLKIAKKRGWLEK